MGTRQCLSGWQSICRSWRTISWAVAGKAFEGCNYKFPAAWFATCLPWSYHAFTRLIQFCCCDVVTHLTRLTSFDINVQMPKKSLVLVGYSSAGSQGKRSICRTIKTIKHGCFVILEGARSINVQLQHHFWNKFAVLLKVSTESLSRNQRHLQNKEIEREREENAETPSTLSFVNSFSECTFLQATSYSQLCACVLLLHLSCQRCMQYAVPRPFHTFSMSISIEKKY